MFEYNNILQTNIFNSFPQYNLNNEGNNINLQKSTLSKANNDKADFSIENKSKNTKKILFGSTIASSILSVGILAMVLGKGIHGSYYKKLSKYAEKFSKEIQNANKETTKDFTTKTLIYTKQGTKKVINTMERASNFTAIKDWCFDKLLRTNKTTKKFADGSRTKFKVIVDKTLGKKYDKVSVKVEDLTSLLKEYNIPNLSKLSDAQKTQIIEIKGISKTLEEWTKILSEQTTKLENIYDRNFSLGARVIRSKKRDGMLQNISQEIENRFFKNNGFKNLSNYKTYVTEDVSKQAQEELKTSILNAKKEITHNIPSIHEDMRISLNKLSEIINPNDNSSVELLQSLKNKIETLRTSGPQKEEITKKISGEITSLIDDAMKIIEKSTNYSEPQKAELLKNITGIKSSILSSVNNSSKGALEEILTILNGLNRNQIISNKDLENIKKLSSKISKGLEHATELEANEYFLKQAELEVGSAATDVVSILFPIAAGTYSIAKGDNKEEKVSATLTTCIPLVGTFATFIYGTMKMFSGAKNLGFTLISGALLAQAGKYCDKLYKQYKSSGSFVKVAKEEYDKLISNLKPEYAIPLKTKNDDK